MEASPVTEGPPLEEIQGNIAGFNKDHQRFVLLSFPDQSRGQAFLAAIVDDVATCKEVHAFNEVFKLVNSRRHCVERTGVVEATWINLALSYKGLQVLQAPEQEKFPEEFRSMRDRAEHLGDKDNSAPDKWRPEFQQEIHAIVLIASDDPADLDQEYVHVQRHITETGITEIGLVDGNTRPEAGHEHFGFKDGVSQPSVDGVTSPPKPGGDLLPLGEFVVGHPRLGEAAHVEPPAGAYSPQQPPVVTDHPSWMVNGSYLVFRRLFQDVPAFQAFVRDTATANGMTEDLVGAKLVGRYKSGAPLQRTPGTPDFDPESPEAAGAANPTLNESEIDNFTYADDPDGNLMPRAAHIRKANPRAQEPVPGKAESDRHRILRRGITYGPELGSGEAPYGGGTPIDGQDRGLLFLCYQSSIANGFEFIQTQWANKEDFPQQGDGRDPITSQDEEDPKFTIPRPSAEPLHLSMKRWVITTGGEYFFSPSISAMRQLGGQT